jgi:hypothetical protein
MTNGNSAEMLRFKKWYKTREQHDSGMITTWQHTWEGWQARAALSVCADGGKDSSGAEPVEESDVRPKERLCGGSHVTCNGVDYCLGHPSCRDIANERAKKEQK